LENERTPATWAISDDDVVWRRINPSFGPGSDPFAWDYDDQCYRPTSQHFSDSSDGTPMSVDIASIAGDPDVTLAGYEGWGLVALNVGELRRLGFEVESKPEPDNPAHAYVHGNKKTSRARQPLKKLAVWVRRLPGMPSDDDPPPTTD
jgi:hypothetical protein